MGHHQPRTDVVEKSQRGANVGLLLKNKPVDAFAELELDEAAVKNWMYEYLKHIPQAASRMGVRIENGKPNDEDVARTAKDRLFVKINPNL